MKSSNEIMFKPQGTKIMLDLHGLSVKEVKQLLEEHFAKIEQYNTGELYLITGKGNHINSDGSRGVLKKILPKLLKPYCETIMQINQEIGAYKVIFKSRQQLTSLKDLLLKLLVNEHEQIQFAELLKQKANEHDIDAILALATIHLHQALEGFDNIEEGTALLLKAKQLGSLEADVQLGLLYHEGLIVQQRHEKAFRHFQYAAKKNHPVAQYYVAVCYLHGKGVKYNDEQAVNWMKKSADQADAYAEDSLGDFYLLGKITKQNKDLGIHYKTKAAKQGLADAQIDLARCYATGYGVKQDYKTAFEWYLSAAQSNKAYAVYQVGSYLLDGRSGFPPNAVEAFGWFLKAAELGDADGQAQVAYQYLFDEVGVDQDIKKGLEWAIKAITQKNRYGYYVMASAHLEGVGVEQDDSKAYSFMKLAAEAGHLLAQYELGLLLIGKKQSSIPQDFDTGIQWLEKAAAQDHMDARQILHDLVREADTTAPTSKGKNKESEELKFSNVNYYELGALAYNLLTISWYMSSQEYLGSLKEKHSLLYNEFVKRVNHLGVEPPKKEAKEKLTDHIFKYRENILNKIGKQSILAIYFNTGFKVMAVKMMKFTQDEADIAKELLDYLRSVNIDTHCINKIEAALNNQIANPKKGFNSKFELLEAELKTQLFSTNPVEEVKERSKILSQAPLSQIPSGSPIIGNGRENLLATLKKIVPDKEWKIPSSGKIWLQTSDNEEAEKILEHFKKNGYQNIVISYRKDSPSTPIIILDNVDYSKLINIPTLQISTQKEEYKAKNSPAFQ